MQHDVYLNPLRQFRPDFPFVVVLQADIAVGPERLCAPLYRSIGDVVSARSAPIVAFDGERFRLILQQLTAIPTSSLRRPLGSLTSYRDDMVYALDWLFTGI
jgi:toxin CcdB